MHAIYMVKHGGDTIMMWGYLPQEEQGCWSELMGKQEVVLESIFLEGPHINARHTFQI